MINAFLIYSFEDLEFRTTFWVTLRNAQMLVVTLSATGIVALKIHVPLLNCMLHFFPQITGYFPAQLCRNPPCVAEPSIWYYFVPG